RVTSGAWAVSAEPVAGALQPADRRAVPLGARAEPADRVLRQHSAAVAVADAAHGRLERAGEPAGTLPVAVEQMKRHALRRLRADAGQALQRLDQLVEQRGVRVRHVRTAASFLPEAP